MARRFPKQPTESATISCNRYQEGNYIVLHNSQRIKANNRLVKGNPKEGDTGVRFARVENAVKAIKAGMTYTFQGHKQEKVEFHIMNMDTLNVEKSFSLSFNPQLVEN